MVKKLMTVTYLIQKDFEIDSMSDYTSQISVFEEKLSSDGWSINLESEDGDLEEEE